VNDYVVFTQGTANLIERLARLPTVPQLGFLLRRKPSSLAFDQHKHHLCKELLAQMVLHRPVEPARLIGNWLLNGSQFPAIRFLDGMRRPVSDELGVE
jgi:hypothetical protein